VEQLAQTEQMAAQQQLLKQSPALLLLKLHALSLISSHTELYALLVRMASPSAPMLATSLIPKANPFFVFALMQSTLQTYNATPNAAYLSSLESTLLVF
jgi:hypothetical protein